ncbi:hypothetical protein AVEN_48342-1 [Araneus ventricosus]|uniref:Reverse transcriptase RNase H-like domain-containing protein n=1 Tax=Araneus ventricosus TaxID=182803 RepID=A0A4Y2AL89_ARAVE|nr:hypothetical protein AVEN_48342-1 [Araneus ventricosus]
MIGSMQAEKLRELQASYYEVKQVHKKVETVLKTIKHEKFDETIAVSFLSGKTMDEVELLYAPFEPGGRRTLAERSKQLGLQPLTLQLLEQKTSLSQINLQSYIKPLRRKVVIGVDPGFSHGFKIACVSSKGEVSETEKKYSTTGRECAAIIFAVKKLQCYLDGHTKFLIMTDHNPLVWLKNNVSLNPRLMRWALALQPYNYTVVHRSGKNHKNVDALSRTPWPD